MFRNRQLQQIDAQSSARITSYGVKESGNRRRAEMEGKRKYLPAEVSMLPDRCVVMKEGGGVQNAYGKTRKLSEMQK
jgi:hypothetical protein